MSASESTLKLAARAAAIPFYPTAGGYSLPDGVALLASNECPDPPLQEVSEAAAAAIAGANRYPDPSYWPLRTALAEHAGVAPEQIAVGNGSCDILLALGEALLEPGVDIVYGWPSFSMYPHLEAASGATGIRVPLDANHRHDLAAMRQAVTEQTRLVIVCNPNNPTSTGVGLAELEDFVQSLPEHVVVLIDEAYIEFATQYKPEESIGLLEAHPQVMILRTFSKLYGLAGMRVGYAICSSEELVGAVARVRQPFSLTVAAQAAATEALQHPGAAAARVAQASESRAFFENGLRALGIEPAQSETNFCWFDLPAPADGDIATGEKQIVDGLREKGVLVRAGGALGRPGALRVTFGTPDENQRFITGLSELLQAR